MNRYDETIVASAANDNLMEQAGHVESLALLDRSMDDIKAGRVRPAKTAIREIADELGLKIDR